MDFYIDINDPKQVTAEVQQRLRDLWAWTHGALPIVAVDGSYDEGTRNAVKAFQSRYGLEPTGIVDYTTWNMLRDVHAVFSEEKGAALPIRPFLDDPGFALRLGMRGDLVYIVQIILNTVNIHYDAPLVALNGLFNQSTSDAIKRFQKLNRLDESGVLDKQTWNRLAEEYNLLVRRNH